MTSVRRSDLGALNPIDDDAFTRRFDVGNPVPGLPYPLRYREILPGHTLPAGVAPEDVRRLLVQAVALRGRCSDADRSALDALTDWSLAIVEDQGRVAGVLQPDLPADFLGPGARRALTLRDLCASDEAIRANGIDRSGLDSAVVRLTLAAQLGHTIHLLHRNRIVYSDLTLGSVAVASRPPRTVLIGCDPTSALNDTTRPPSLEAGSQALDTSRLALCVIRTLAKGPGATQLTDPGRVSAVLGRPGVDLIMRALRPSPAPPPTAEEISRYLGLRLATLAHEAGVLEDGTVRGLPPFDIAAQLRGRLPRLAVPDLPSVAAPRVAAAWPRRPTVSTDEHPPPRLEPPPIDLNLAGIRPASLTSGMTELSGTLVRAYADANQQMGDALRAGLRALHQAIEAHMRPRESAGQVTDARADRAAGLDARQR